MSALDKKRSNLRKFNSVYALYDKELSNNEVFEINQNLMGFIQTLLKMDKKLKDSESGKPE